MEMTMFAKKLSLGRSVALKALVLGLLLGVAQTATIPRAVADDEVVHNLTIHNQTPYAYYVQYDVAPDRPQSRWDGWLRVPAHHVRTFAVSSFNGITIRLRGYEIGHTPPDFSWERDVAPDSNGDYVLGL
jgi:hypothetical protein